MTCQHRQRESAIMEHGHEHEQPAREDLFIQLLHEDYHFYRGKGKAHIVQEKVTRMGENVTLDWGAQTLCGLDSQFLKRLKERELRDDDLCAVCRHCAFVVQPYQKDAQRHYIREVSKQVEG
uniref:Uncharacterized protein n=1 Tax=Thermosporothrix sp. COM3 TaxID=2490863 RepID=A0A455SFX3_9CHLR|nr:hypothetical protein KTC_09720 [Thermosporothrix sp. COM3]